MTGSDDSGADGETMTDSDPSDDLLTELEQLADEWELLMSRVEDESGKDQGGWGVPRHAEYNRLQNCAKELREVIEQYE